MNKAIPGKGLCVRRQRGAILVYVLWILVLITALAMQLSSSSRALTLNQSAAAQQLKTRMQIESALQFAQFRISQGSWQDRRFELFLNDQDIQVEIFNESGFISIYITDDRDLRNAFKRLGLETETLGALRAETDQDNGAVRFNSFDELLRIDGIDDRRRSELARLFSIYHEDPVNPWQAPTDVLMMLDGVDQYRVEKLEQVEESAERRRLRDELVGIISGRDEAFSQDETDYFRIRVRLANERYRAVLRHDRRGNRFRTLLVEADSQIGNSRRTFNE